MVFSPGQGRYAVGLGFHILTTAGLAHVPTGYTG